MKQKTSLIFGRVLFAIFQATLFFAIRTIDSGKFHSNNLSKDVIVSLIAGISFYFLFDVIAYFNKKYGKAEVRKAE